MLGQFALTKRLRLDGGLAWLAGGARDGGACTEAKFLGMKDGKARFEIDCTPYSLASPSSAFSAEPRMIGVSAE